MKKYKNLVWLFATLGLASCGSVLSPQSQRATTSYQIIDSSITVPANSCSQYKIGGTLFLSPTRASAPYDSYKMYYSNDVYQLSQYGYSQWIVPPAELINQNIMKKVTASCTFKSIVFSSAVAAANYHLMTYLVTLREEIDPATNTSKAHLVIGSELSDLKQNKMLGVFMFDQTVPTDNTPRGFVEGTSKLMTDYDNQVVDWLQKQVNK